MLEQYSETTTQTFYITNIPSGDIKKKIISIFIWDGPVDNVKLPTNPEILPCKGYATVKMVRKTTIASLMGRLSNTKIDGYKIFVTSDQNYTETRNNIAHVLSGSPEDKIKVADEMLLDIEKRLPDSKNVLYSKSFVIKLKQVIRTGKELNIDSIMKISSELLIQKEIHVKQKKKKKSRFVQIISTPMGGQSKRG